MRTVTQYTETLALFEDEDGSRILNTKTDSFAFEHWKDAQRQGVALICFVADDRDFWYCTAEVFSDHCHLKPPHGVAMPPFHLLLSSWEVLGYRDFLTAQARHQATAPKA